MLDPRFQPSLESLLQRMGEEISARAVLLLHENGQVVSRHGWIEEHEYPAMAALVSAMIATGKSLGSLGENFLESPTRFSCDSEEVGLYMVAVSPELWLAALYEQPLNPGQVRMKVRRYAATCARLGVEKPESWDSDTDTSADSGTDSAHWPATATVTDHCTSTDTDTATSPSATMPPQPVSATTFPEKITQENSSLFTNITDDEIDRLFENTHS